MLSKPSDSFSASAVEVVLAQQTRAIDLAESWSDRLRRQVEALDPLRHAHEVLLHQSIAEQALAAASVGDQLQRHIDSVLGLGRLPDASSAAKEAERLAMQGMARISGLDAADLWRTQLLKQNAELDGIRESAAGTSRYFDDLASQRDAVRRAVEQATQWGGAFQSVEAARRWHQDQAESNSLRSMLSALKAASQGIGPDEASVVEDLRGSVEDASAAAEQLQGIVADAAHEYSLKDAAEHIVRAIEATQEPFRKKVLYFMVLPMLFVLLGAVINPFADFHIKKSLESSSPQGDTKAVKHAAREAVGDLQVVSEFRFVSSKAPLSVRFRASARSPVLGSLRFGQAVRVLKQERDFTLIVWVDRANQLEIQGWVFSRYLKRFD